MAGGQRGVMNTPSAEKMEEKDRREEFQKREDVEKEKRLSGKEAKRRAIVDRLPAYRAVSDLVGARNGRESSAPV